MYDVVNQARYCPIKLRRICGHKFNANREIINSIQASYWNPRPKGINVVFPKWYDTAHLIIVRRLYLVSVVHCVPAFISFSFLELVFC